MFNKFVVIVVEMVLMICCSVFMIVLLLVVIGFVKEFKLCVCEGDIVNGVLIIKIMWVKIMYYVVFCVVVSVNMRVLIIEIKNFSIVGVWVLIELYK